MHQSADKTATTLSQLARACEDGAKVFQNAADASDGQDGLLGQTLACYGTERRLFAQRLSGIIERCGGQAPTQGSVRGSLQRGWTGLQQAIGLADSAAHLAACERADENALVQYSDALAQKIPSHIRQVLKQQKHRMHASLEHLQRLRVQM